MFDNSKVSDISVIKPAERVEGCELVKLSRDKDPNSKSYRSVTFSFKQKSTGAELAHREFAPNRVIAGKTLDDDNFKKNITLAHSRVAHITRAFLDEATFEKIKIADSGLANIDKMWDDYIAMTGAALQVDATGVPQKAKGIECALKVVYNGKYSALPKVAPFISTANHPKQFSTNPQYDKYVLSAIQPDAEAPAGGGFTAGTGTNGFGAQAPTGDFSSAPAEHASGF
jgi:hypothetical protein